MLWEPRRSHYCCLGRVGGSRGFDSRRPLPPPTAIARNAQRAPPLPAAHAGAWRARPRRMRDGSATRAPVVIYEAHCHPPPHSPRSARASAPHGGRAGDGGGGAPGAKPARNQRRRRAARRSGAAARVPGGRRLSAGHPGRQRGAFGALPARAGACRRFARGGDARSSSAARVAARARSLLETRHPKGAAQGRRAHSTEVEPTLGAISPCRGPAAGGGGGAPGAKPCLTKGGGAQPGQWHRRVNARRRQLALGHPGRRFRLTLAHPGRQRGAFRTHGGTLQISQDFVAPPLSGQGCIS